MSTWSMPFRQIYWLISKKIRRLIKKLIIAGRIIFKRIMGATTFYELQDAEGRIQYMQRDEITGRDKVFITVYKKVDVGILSE